MPFRTEVSLLQVGLLYVAIQIWAKIDNHNVEDRLNNK
jgi:hypothetical protein